MLITTAAVAICVLLAFVALIVIVRATAFSRHVDGRRSRRARLQDDWSEIVKAAGELARAGDRRSK